MHGPNMLKESYNKVHDISSFVSSLKSDIMKHKDDVSNGHLQANYK